MVDTEKYEVLMRLRAIEMIVYWEGRLITSMIIKLFGVSRQQVSKDIKLYQEKYNPDSLDYDIGSKGYKPAKSFKPKLTNGHINEYMDLMSGLVSESSPIIFVEEPHIAAVHMPERAVKPELVRELIRACRNHSVLSIEYASMANPEPHQRNLSPHTLIYSGFRWHVRGYCHTRNSYRDFVISRISVITAAEGLEYVDNTNDTNWHEDAEIIITPNPLLDEAQQKLIANDYAMDDKQLKLTIKKALVHYTLHRYQVAVSDEEKQNAKQYTLTLKDDQQANQLLFGENA